MSDCTYVVLLNWRGAKDTIDCLETLFRTTHAHFKVIVCDNNSGDGSLDEIRRWAAGEHEPRIPSESRLAALFQGHRPCIVLEQLTRQEAEAGNIASDSNLILIDNGANLGFAAGNNVGIRLALSQPDMDTLWLLNNDTLVEHDCLSQMQATLSEADRPSVCGSMIHFFDDPFVIQAVGGNRFDRRTGVASSSAGRHLIESDPRVAELAESPKLAYLSGCSMLLPRGFLETVGLMNEDYFLYYEEIDWFTRANGRFDIKVAARARLYHREGSSIGSPGLNRGPSAFSDFYLFNSRLKYMRVHTPALLPLGYCSALLALGKRIVRKEFANARAILDALLGSNKRFVPDNG